MKNIKAIIVTILLSIVLVSLLIFAILGRICMKPRIILWTGGQRRLYCSIGLRYQIRLLKIFRRNIRRFESEYYKYHKATYPTAIVDKLLGEQTFDSLGAPLEEYARGCRKVSMRIPGSALFRGISYRYQKMCERQSRGWGICCGSQQFIFWNLV